jgi:aminoglycoside phosphotransferase family enzyme/predicted kinase
MPQVQNFNLIETLCMPGVLETDGRVEMVETHISWILLTGKYVYKIKKPVDLGFVDFSSLEKREFFCHEELRLNRRLAKDIYLDVVAITGSTERPDINGKGPTIEYAVKMVQFDRERELDKMVLSKVNLSKIFQQFSKTLAEFHETSLVADTRSPFASPEGLGARSLDNFDTILAQFPGYDIENRIASLRHWTVNSLHRNTTRFNQRKDNGRIRECHGDLHLGNLVIIGDEIVAFDCLEFNEDFRWIDVASELAFLLMDLDANSRQADANAVLNWYLEYSGDYELIPLLQHYMVYRAMVRAKVSCLTENETSLASDHDPGLEKYLALAEFLVGGGDKPRIIITHGLSGCGKTWIGDRLLELSRFVRIRSDVVRKQLHGLIPDGNSNSETGGGIYTSEASSRVYSRLRELAEMMVSAGYTVLVDATFLRKPDRQRLAKTAEKLNFPYTILSLTAPYTVLASRINRRQKAGNDASEAGLDVLHKQIEFAEELDPDEQGRTIHIDTSIHWSPQETGKLLQELRGQL